MKKSDILSKFNKKQVKENSGEKQNVFKSLSCGSSFVYLIDGKIIFRLF